MAEHLKSLQLIASDREISPGDVRYVRSPEPRAIKTFVLDHKGNSLLMLSYDNKEQVKENSFLYWPYSPDVLHSNLVLVDYGKGEITEHTLPSVFNNENLRHIVVSCKTGFEKYRKYSSDPRMIVVCNRNEYYANPILGEFQRVVVTLDKHGAAYYEYGNLQLGSQVQTWSAPVWSDIGAGDAFTAAFAVTLINKHEEDKSKDETYYPLLQQALDYGASWASYCIQFPPWIAYKTETAMAYKLGVYLT